MPPLTGVRFIAASAVVGYHYGPAWIHALASAGHVAVSIFYVLSGFVLACNYAGRSEWDRRSFWVSRFARIYPAYFVSLLASIPLLLAELPGGLTAVDALKCASVVTLTQSWVVVPAMFWNYPAWSLSDEAFFYFTFPWTCACASRLKQRLNAWLAWVLILNVASSALYLLSPRFTFQVFPMVRLPQFLLGLVLGRLFLVRGHLPPNQFGWVTTLGSLGLAGITLTNGPHVQTVLSAIFLMPSAGMMIYGLASGGGSLGACLSRPSVVLLARRATASTFSRRRSSKY
jgi:peptidoglycan/LPS O-acetylase OafA/YrhL